MTRHILRKVFILKAKHLFTKLNVNLGIVIPVVLTFLIIIFWATGVYLAET